MIIITDDPSYALETLGSPLHFNPLSDRKTAQQITSLSGLFFPAGNLYYSHTGSDSVFSSLFIRRHAQVSQFDLLADAGSYGSDPQQNIVCFAGSGDKFHGFHQRKWLGLQGNIHLSMSLFPGRKIEKPSAAFLILAANAVVQTIDSLGQLSGLAGIHWINDIVISGLKTGGVLCRTQMRGDITERVILGIGLNVHRTPQIIFDPCIRGATNINQHVSGRPPYQISEIFWLLLGNLERNYRQLLSQGYRQLLNYYIEHSVLPGKNVAVFSDSQEGHNEKIGEGRVAGINEDLELLVGGFKEPLRKGRVRLID